MFIPMFIMMKNTGSLGIAAAIDDQLKRSRHRKSRLLSSDSAG
jgi:hypothetical protein